MSLPPAFARTGSTEGNTALESQCFYQLVSQNPISFFITAAKVRRKYGTNEVFEYFFRLCRDRLLLLTAIRLSIKNYGVPYYASVRLLH